MALSRHLLAGFALIATVAFAGCSDGEQKQVTSGPAVAVDARSLLGGRTGLRPARRPGRGWPRPPVTPLAGWLTPAAVPSADGRYLAYNSWRELRHDDPKLSWSDQGIETRRRARDSFHPPLRQLRPGADETSSAEGAFSLAWRGDGALAYFKGAERDYRAGVSYVGDVIVRPSARRSSRSLVDRTGPVHRRRLGRRPARRLREHEGEALDVVVFDGPGRMRVARRGLLARRHQPGRQARFRRARARPKAVRPSASWRWPRAARSPRSTSRGSIRPWAGLVTPGDWRGEQRRRRLHLRSRRLPRRSRKDHAPAGAQGCRLQRRRAPLRRTLPAAV